MISSSVDPTATPSTDPSATPSVDPSTTNSVDPSITSSADPSATSGTATTTSSSFTESCDVGSTVVQRRGATQTAGAPAREATNGCIITNPDKGGEDSLDGALSAVQDVTNILRLRGINGHRSPRNVLAKCAPKSGKPCSGSPSNQDFVLPLDDYPSNGELAADIDSWGYKIQDNLCKYDWLDGKTQIVGNNYNSEHVMKWQTVTDFFGKMNAKGVNTE